jgi:hypothetical protein
VVPVDNVLPLASADDQEMAASYVDTFHALVSMDYQSVAMIALLDSLDRDWVEHKVGMEPHVHICEKMIPWHAPIWNFPHPVHVRSLSHHESERLSLH